MKYRREIDGLRAVAVVPVILFHAGFSAFSGGFVGVDIFFVISGYLITTIIVSELERDSFSLLRFYERRARRILPALFFMMLCCLPFAWFWMLPQDLRRFSASLVAVPLFASNILFFVTSGYFDTVSELKPLLHTWSLAVEEQYYVLFPLLLMLAWKFGRRWVVGSLLALGVVSVAVAQWGAAAQPSFAFYLLPARGFELLIGALIAVTAIPGTATKPVGQPVREAVALGGLAMILVAIFAFDRNTPSPSLLTLVPTLGAGAIIVSANDRTTVGRLLGSRAFVGIGLISYSTYLWHQPFFAFAKLRTLDDLETPVLLLLSALSLFAGFLSWKYVEQPFRSREKTRVQTIVRWGLVLTLLMLALGVAGYAANGVPSRVPERLRPLITNPQEPFANDACRQAFPQLKQFDACLLSTDRPPEVLLLGDSHSQHFYKSLAAASKGHSVMNLAAWSCLPFASAAHLSKNACEAKIAAAVRFVEATPSIKVVYLAGHWGYLSSGGFRIDNQNYRLPNLPTPSQTHSFVRSAARVLDALARSGRRIVLLRDIPDLDFGVQSCYDMMPYKHNEVRASCSMSIASFRERNRAYESLMTGLTARYPAVAFYDPTGLFCSATTGLCDAREGSEPLYFDSDHLTLRGSDRVVADLLRKHPVDGPGVATMTQ